MEIYDIYLEKEIVGRAKICVKGLYLHITAQCTGIPEMFYRLYLCMGHRYIDLGLCLHKNGCYIWDKMIPKKEIHEGELEFILQAPVNQADCDFISIDPNREFSYFSSIERCCFAEKGGMKGIYIKDCL